MPLMRSSSSVWTLPDPTHDGNGARGRGPRSWTWRMARIIVDGGVDAAWSSLFSLLPYRYLPGKEEEERWRWGRGEVAAAGGMERNPRPRGRSDTQVIRGDLDVRAHGVGRALCGA